MAFSERNSTFAPLDSAQTFTGQKDSISDWSSAVTLIKADKNCQMRHEYSSDGSNWDLLTTFVVTALSEQECRSNAAGRYFRMVIINTAGEDMSYLRASTSYKTAADPAAATSVEVTSLPPIEIAAGQEVTLASGAEVSLAAGTSVDIGTLPAITIAAAQEVGLASGATVALAAGSEVALASGATVSLSAGSEVALAVGTAVAISPGSEVGLASNTQVLVSYRAGLKSARSLSYTATGQLIWDAACTLHGFCLQNLSPTNDCYVKFYNQATAPANTDTPFATHFLKAESTLDFQRAQGIALDTGLGIRVTDALADSDNTNPAGTVIGTVQYLA